MKIVFFGTGRFAVPSLARIVESGHMLQAVVTQPDRPRGRGQRTGYSDVKNFVVSAFREIPLLQPERSSDISFRESLSSFGADVFVVIDHGRILKDDILAIPCVCCVNLHPSLLPKYRGAAPVNWAILNGETETGNTLIKMNRSMDAGDIILQERTAINRDETSAELLSRLALSGSVLLQRGLDMLAKGDVRPELQDESRVSYAPKLKKSDGVIDWNKPADYILRMIRAFEPWPGAYTYIDGRKLRLLKAVRVDIPCSDITPGKVLDKRSLKGSGIKNRNRGWQNRTFLF